MNYNPSTNMAHFYDENSVEIGKLKVRPEQIAADAEISLWRLLIEIGQLESTEAECVEEMFERLNKELGIDEFDKKSKRQKTSEIEPIPKKSIKIPSKVDANESVVLYDILYTRDKSVADRVWQDGLLKFYPNLKLGEFYEGNAGKLVHKKSMEEVREGEIIEEAAGGKLSIEICSIRKDESKVANGQSVTIDKRVFSILYTTDKHKKSKKWLDGIIEYFPDTKLAKFLEEETHACFYKKILPEGVNVGEEMVTGMYIVQIDHEIFKDKEKEIEKENVLHSTKISISKNKVKSVVASEGVPLEGRSNDELLALLNQSNKSN